MSLNLFQSYYYIFLLPFRIHIPRVLSFLPHKIQLIISAPYNLTTYGYTIFFNLTYIFPSLLNHPEFGHKIETASYISHINFYIQKKNI